MKEWKNRSCLCMNHDWAPLNVRNLTSNISQCVIITGLYSRTKCDETPKNRTTTLKKKCVDRCEGM
jgi:hypothetical protein